MKVTVQNATVSKNIELFKKAAEKIHLQKKGKTEFPDKGLKGYVNTVTGEISFGETVKESPEKWKFITFYIGEEGDFLILGIDESQFSLDDFFPSAYRSMLETIKTLNLILQLIQGRFDFDLLLQQLDQLEVAVSKDIIHDAWHQADRLRAEELLQVQMPGTYLFRKDEYAEMLEDQLIIQHKMPVKCITLSYLDGNKKVVDRTVVKRENRWLFYNDDPSLDGPLFPSLFALLDSLGNELKLALLSQ